MARSTWLGSINPRVLVVEVNLVHHEVVRDINDFVVLDLASDPRVTLVNGELPGFVGIGDRVRTTVVEVAEFLEQLRGDFNAFASGSERVRRPSDGYRSQYRRP